MPRMCSRISAAAPVGVAAAQQARPARVLGVGAGQHLLGVGDQRDQVAHLPLDLGHLGDQARRVRGLGDADVEADVGAPVLLEVRPARPSARPARRARRARARCGALGGQDRRADLDRDPVVEHRPGVARRAARRRARRAAGARRRRCRRCARGPRSGGPLWTSVVSAWRRVEREIRSSSASSRSGGSLLPGASSPMPDRGPEPLDRLLERGRRPHRLEHRLDGGVALHPTTVTPPIRRRAASERRAPPGSPGSPARCRESGPRPSRARERPRR